ncbi:chondroitin AC lyase [Mariniphaga anaerophila]|uniref:Chondroitin AC lyase n=1 Tax=Mariniphaga anaerophila TaxID=1484053 RepID=A0A1M4W1H6_9BACT|nr:polysaccharide lyase family 8 super-sandwich domain-containing protein [Mariniphaga anaerophila]SHE75088.1 chondroitin AC lyase [Mariniphaga anaerophila]
MTINLKPVALLFCLLLAHSAQSDDFVLIKQRVFQNLMETPVDKNEVANLLNSIQENGTWPDINYQDVSREGFQHSRHSANIVTLARAYNTKSSRFFKSTKVKNVVELALKNWVDHDYICDNWWHNQIGTPNNLVHVMLLIGDELPKDLVEKAQPIINRANIDAPGARPGGDRIKIAGIQAKNLLFLGDRETFDEVVRVIENEIKYVEWIGRKYGYTYRINSSGFANRSAGGRGIQYGNSFHHRGDGVNNTLSYGLSYADAFVEWAVYTANTRYSFADDKQERLVDYFLDGICKTSIYGKFPDPGAKNRSVCRRGTLRPYSAKTAENLLLATAYRRKELKEIADIRNQGIKPTVSHATFFWNTGHFSYQRPDWFTSVRMYSTRTHNMEEPYNSEGLLNHHRGDGANHISRTGDEYYDIFPVFDYQKVPGATIMQKAELPAPNQIQKLGLTDFVGAVTDGIYGAVAFDFKSPHDPLVARKSWFFFDEEYVCLGAGISCKQNLPVVTTVNQCLLRGEVALSSQNKKVTVEKGEKTFENVDWVFHDRIGYVFPNPTDVELKNSAATGSWWNISKQISTPKEEVTADVFKLWLNHGSRPSDAAYEYIVVPATSMEKMEENRSKNNITILKNTPEIQAVENTNLEICQVVFYKGGEIEIFPTVKLFSDNPGIVMLKMKNGSITEISVADPNRELSRFNLSVSTKIEKSGETFTASWNENTRMTHISIELPGGNYAGSSATVKL